MNIETKTYNDKDLRYYKAAYASRFDFPHYNFNVEDVANIMNLELTDIAPQGLEYVHENIAKETAAQRGQYEFLYWLENNFPNQ